MAPPDRTAYAPRAAPLHALSNRLIGSAELLPGTKPDHTHLQLVTSHSEGNLTGVHPAARSVRDASRASLLTQPDSQARAFPYQALTPEQQAKYDACLEYFSTTEAYPQQLNPTKGAPLPLKPASNLEKMRLLTRESILRYLRATRWDVEEAKKRLTNTIAFRREYGADDIEPDYVEPEARSGKETVLGFDKHGRPLHYMHPHRNDTPETERQMKYAVWILDACIDLMPPGVEQLALMINFENKSRNPTSISNAKLMLYILQNHYVERLGVAMCINVPWIFKLFWNAIQSFIDPNTKSKCMFDEAIMGEVPASQLLGDFGGDVDPVYDHATYWPTLIKTVNKRRAESLDRFVNVCGAKVGASEYIIRGGEDAWPGSAPARPPDVPRHVPPPKSAPSQPLAETKAAEAEPSRPSASSVTTTATAVTTSDAPSAGETGSGASTPQRAPSETQAPILAIEDDNDPKLERFLTAQTVPEPEPMLVKNQPIVASPTKEIDMPIVSAENVSDSSPNHGERAKPSQKAASLHPPEPKHMNRSASCRSAASIEAPGMRNSSSSMTRKESTQKGRSGDGWDSLRGGWHGLVRSGSQLLHGRALSSHGSAHASHTSHRLRQSTSPARESEHAHQSLGSSHPRRSFSPGHHRLSRMLYRRSASHDNAAPAPSGSGHANSNSNFNSNSILPSGFSSHSASEYKLDTHSHSHNSHPQRTESDDLVAHAAAVRASHDTGERKTRATQAALSALTGHNEPAPAPSASAATGPTSAGAGTATATPPGEPIVRVEVLYFAGARTALGTAREDVDVPAPYSAAALVGALNARHGDNKQFLQVLSSGRWAVEEELLEPEEMSSCLLRQGQTAALLPPVSGG